MSNKLVIKENITSLVNKLSIIDTSIYGEILNKEVIDVLKCIIISFALKMRKINPSVSIEQIVPQIIAMTGGVDFFDDNGKPITQKKETFYTPSKIITLTTIAVIFIGVLLIFISSVYNIESQIYTQTAVGDENKYNKASALVSVEQPSSTLVPIEQQINDELYEIYKLTSGNQENNKFKSALDNLKRLSSSIEETVLDAGSQIQTYISLANPFDHVVANVIGKLLIPENNELVITKLLNDKYNKAISSNKGILNVRVNNIISELTNEIKEIQETINKLNDPNLIQRANNYVQNVLVYFVSPKAVLDTGKIKLDKIINILSQIEYIKNDFNVGVKQLLTNVKITADEYSNNLYNSIVVLYYLFVLLTSFGVLFIREMQKPSENAQQITYNVQLNVQQGDATPTPNGLPQITNRRPTRRGGRKYAVRKNKTNKTNKTNKNKKQKRINKSKKNRK